jgi:hypothetical protein
MRQKSKERRNHAVIRVTMHHIFQISAGCRPERQVLSGREGSGSMWLSGE